MNKKLPSVLKELNFDGLQRIEIALEGSWNNTVVTVWDIDKRFIGFNQVVKSHESFKPSIELYFLDIWIGIHCFKVKEKLNIFDEQFALAIIEYIENKLKGNI